jgi:hypothetical protein
MGISTAAKNLLLELLIASGGRNKFAVGGNHLLTK